MIREKFPDPCCKLQTTDSPMRAIRCRICRAGKNLQMGAQGPKAQFEPFTQRRRETRHLLKCRMYPLDVEDQWIVPNKHCSHSPETPLFTQNITAGENIHVACISAESLQQGMERSPSSLPTQPKTPPNPGSRGTTPRESRKKRS